MDGDFATTCCCSSTVSHLCLFPASTDGGCCSCSILHLWQHPPALHTTEPEHKAEGVERRRISLLISGLLTGKRERERSWLHSSDTNER